ncbi:MAG TPA: uroporphyrinogen decarboxylase family protein [Spirochaetia bacterium]|nr:uroporphyrinogen decarboxylase family protein [Spirochaetia bacterium]
MTLKEKIQAAFRFEEVRPVPYTVWYDGYAMEKLDRYYGGSDWRERIQDHILRITVEWRPETYISADRFRDIHGSVWQEGDPLHLVEPVLKEPSLKGFEVPSYAPFVRGAAERKQSGSWFGRPQVSFEESRKRFEEAGDRVFTVAGYGYGLFESGWMIRGYEEFFSDIVLEPGFVNELLDILTERQLEVIDILTELPCDAIMVTDDFGDQRGIAIGPERWRALFKKRLGRLYRRIHEAGKMTFHHSCGNVFDIIPDLIDIGLDVLQSVQPEAMPVYEIKKRYGKNLRLWGGLGTQQLLPFGKPEEIRAEVRRLKREIGKGGGYVFTSSKPIMREVPVENAVALIEESMADEI